MSKQGWIKLHRQLMNNPLWTSEPFTRGQAWVDLLMLAEYETKGEFKAGSIYKSKNWLAARWKWDKRKVTRFLRELESGTAFGTADSPMVCTKNRSTSGTVITIAKWGFFQHGEQGDGTSFGTKKCTADGTASGNHLKKTNKFYADGGALDAPSSAAEKKTRWYRDESGELRWEVVDE